MPQSLMYDSADEANNRLAGTIVSYDGEPVYIRDAQNHADGCIRLSMIPHPFNGSATRKRIDSPAFNKFRPIPLGFCNFFTPGGNRHVTWCERTSPRSRRQGLCSDNVRMITLSPGGSGGMRGIRLEGAFSGSDAFREMVTGQYPSFDLVLRTLVPDSSIAVSREFALRRGKMNLVTLHHKLEEVGVVFRGQLFLSNDHQFLMETIVEERNLPNRVEIL